MILHLTVSIPGGLSSARSSRTCIRQAVTAALLAYIQQERETPAGVIVNQFDRKIGEVRCTAMYSDAGPEGQGRYPKDEAGFYKR